MNPEARPFTPASTVSIISSPSDSAASLSQKISGSSQPSASLRQKSARERRRRFNAQRAKSQIQAGELINSSNSTNDPENDLGDATSANQHKLKTNDAKKQRRRQRNRTKCNCTKADLADATPTSFNSIKTSSHSQIKTADVVALDQLKPDCVGKKQAARRQRARANRSRRPKEKTDKCPASTTSYHDEFDIEECFPTIAPSTISRLNENAKSFWHECLGTKPILPVHVEQSEPDKAEEIQSTVYNEFGVPLTILSKSRLELERRDVADRSIDIPDGFEQKQQQQQRQESPPTEYFANPTPLLTNLKTKWSDSQMSRIRKRWWDAERAKRQMEIERRRKEKEQLLMGDESDDDTSSVSQCSSSLRSIDSYDECDVGMKHSSLTSPFDERKIECSCVIETPETAASIHHHYVSEQGVSLEEKCLQSAHQVHTIIHQCYLLKLKPQQVAANILPGTTYLDAENVLMRLLERQDIEDNGKWESITANLQDLLGEVTPIISKGVELLSADLAALDPLQLAIVLDLPHLIRRILFSSRCQSSMEDKFGRTPLMLACEMNRLECIETLLQLTTKPKLDQRENEGGNSAYHFCCINGNITPDDTNTIHSPAADALELLLSKTPFQLQKRVLFSVNNKRQSLLHLACVSGDLRLVDCILNELNSRGSSLVTKALNMEDAYHCVPFISAVKADERDVAMHLIVSRFANRTDFSTWFESCPLTIACSNGSIDMIRMLLELGYHKNYDINRALLEAVQCKSNTVHDDGHDEATRIEIISLLIDAGANPHSAVAITQFPDKHLVHGFRGSKSVKEKARKGVTPLALAAHCEDVGAVRTMLNSFSLSLSSLRSSRRCDPLLRMQPETYFQTLESREDAAIDSSLQSALVTSLFQLWKSQSTASAKIALIIYRRGVILSQKSMQWLSNCLLMDNMCPPPLVCSAKQSIIFERVRDSDDSSDGAVTTDWSKVFLSSNVTSYSRVSCSHLQQMIDEQKANHKLNGSINKHHLKEDEFYLIAEDQKLIAHKSIVSKKSEKLAAAIRFNESQLSNESDSLSLRLGLPLAAARMMLAHIYHGSIVFGLKSAADLQCHQLLELALLAEEYLCPSLLFEIEMRLLAFGARECVCCNCLADKNLRCEGGDIRYYNYDETRSTHVYNTPVGCSRLITPETALDVLAVSQQLESTHGDFETKCLNSGESSGHKVAIPFVAAKIEAISTILGNFKAVIASNSFLRQIDDNKGDISRASSYHSAMIDQDESAIMLLLLCLHELKHNPPG